MSQNHRFILQPYKSLSDRYTCPSCNEKKKFSRYIDTATNDQLDDNCGRCNKSDSCGFHLTPAEFFKENPKDKPLDFQKWTPVPMPPPRPASYIDKAIFKKSLGLNSSNTFTNFLITLFGKERAEMLVNRYHIGTTKNGETIFYQVDLQGNVRSGKVMKYNIIDSTQTALGKDCKRDKSVNPNWVHSKLKLENFNLSQCLFGEHLLTDNRTVAVVESAKSAVFASVYFPSFVWVSCEGKEGLGIDKLKVLKGRNVVLFPDLGGFDKWTEKSKQMTFCKSVVVSDLLEKLATDAERASGLDLADYLLRLPAPAETVPAVESPSFQESLESDCEVVESDPIAKHDTPFWEDIPQISDAEFKESVIIIDWFNKHLKVFDGVFVLDGVAINDIKDVIVKHLKVITENQSSAVISIKFLKRVKVAFMGA